VRRLRLTSGHPLQGEGREGFLLVLFLKKRKGKKNSEKVESCQIYENSGSTDAWPYFWVHLRKSSEKRALGFANLFVFVFFFFFILSFLIFLVFSRIHHVTKRKDI
jgi:hypothetical protein